MNSIKINASTAYEVMIGSGLLNQAGTLIGKLLDERNKRVFVVTDDTVEKLYLPQLKNALSEAGIESEVFVIPHGEQSKNVENYIRIINSLATMNYCRSNAVVGLGGGVVGDLAGFAAATYQRGMMLIQIPTTVLAAVDSSVGGKTGVDLEAGKNLLGAFYQPRMVICDTDTFATLPEEIRRDGCAEIVKYGILANARLFEDIIDVCEAGEAPDEDIIAKCVSIKKHYVEGDEYDKGMRQYLNLGHTVGHAIELCSNYTVSHGAAVAAGTVIATRIALKIGVCEPECPIEIIEGIRSMGFDIGCNYSSQEISEAVMHDKKRSGDNITMILPKRVGECMLHTLRSTELKEILEEVLG